MFVVDIDKVYYIELLLPFEATKHLTELSYIVPVVCVPFLFLILLIFALFQSNVW